jgi:NADH-quinone oxidoreductase subunit J
VLILFVLMLLGVDEDEDLTRDPLVGQRALAGVAGLALLGLLLAAFIGVSKYGLSGASPPAGSAYALSSSLENVTQLGRLIFTDWIFAFEITAGLLTIAVIGAVLMTRRPDDYEPLPEPESMSDEIPAAAEEPS